ncbi:MAG: nucleotidyltransferase family protein [bacterium JZ-2024 1]
MTEYGAVFAGGRASESLAKAFKVRWKAEIVFEGDRLVDRALHIVRQAGGFSRIFVVLPSDVALTDGLEDCHIVPSRDRLMENFLAVMEEANEVDLVYMVACDAPRITPEMLNRVRSEIHKDPGKDIYYTVVEKKRIEAKYPGARRTYVRLREGVFTGGNVIAVNPRRILVARERIEEAVALRKKPLALAGKIGALFLLKALSGRLSLEEAVARVEAISGLKGKVIVSRDPEIAMDIDEPVDYSDLAVECRR